MKRLSGWVRLWIVCAVAIWAVGYWHVSQSYFTPPTLIERMLVRDHAPPTSSTITRGIICINATGGDYDFNQCMSSASRFESAKASVDADQRRYEDRLLLRLVTYLLAPFALALLWLIGSWIWRGFSSPPR